MIVGVRPLMDYTPITFLIDYAFSSGDESGYR